MKRSITRKTQSPPSKRGGVGRTGGSSSDGIHKASTTSRPKVLPDNKSAVAEHLNLKNPHTSVGEVFVVGSGDCGQLGLGQEVTSKSKPARLDYFADKEIVSVAAGGLHNMALSTDGKLYSWGCNDQQALGRKTVRYLTQINLLIGREGEETEPRPVEGLDGIIIVQVVCGDSITAALSDKGLVYAWGTIRNKNGILGFRPNVDIQPRPTLIPELKNVTRISAGANHVAAFTHDNKILTWGSGEQGQLGRRILPRSEKESSLIPRIINLRLPRGHGATGAGGFASVWCGGHHMFAVHSSGAVFGFGLNNHGQLGVGDTDEEDGPRRVELADDVTGVEYIAGSEHHSVLLDSTGRVFSFGRNDDGQLGLGDDEHRVIPTQVSLPQPMREISAYGAFTLALSQGQGGNNMWGWGYGEMGQLCNGNEDEQSPLHIELKGRHVLHIAAGGQHTLMLLRAKDQPAGTNGPATSQDGQK